MNVHQYQMPIAILLNNANVQKRMNEEINQFPVNAKHYENISLRNYLSQLRDISILTSGKYLILKYRPRNDGLSVIEHNHREK